MVLLLAALLTLGKGTNGSRPLSNGTSHHGKVLGPVVVAGGQYTAPTDAALEYDFGLPSRLAYHVERLSLAIFQTWSRRQACE